jgi:deoxyribodipyrimidine photo-lyase
MNPSAFFPPTLLATQERIAAVRPAQYARSRNAIDGAVSYLSPYITHGFVSLPEVLAGVAANHMLTVQHKFVFELGWRAYFHHVWQHRGDGVLQSLHAGVLPEAAYSPEVPPDIREARTGVPVIDQAVRTLYATGYLHNHARMWLASYVVHLRKVHWRAGADWMVAHLLDGDLASNHLSWQWVAGTGSHKPYLFNAENVARYAPPRWHSEGTVIDASYEALDAMARSPRLVASRLAVDGVHEPPRLVRPPADPLPDPAQWAGRDVWLVHPWALGEPPDDLPPGVVTVGWWPTTFHAMWPWSAARWSFVHTRMHAMTSLLIAGDGDDLARMLASARSVQTVDNPHVSSLLPSSVQQRAAPRLFSELARPSASFSHWWIRSTRNATQLWDLPGMTGILTPRAHGHLFETTNAPMLAQAH